MSRRFLSMPVRRALDGVTWASLSVQWVPTEREKRRLYEDNGVFAFKKPDKRRPRLHPLNNGRYPFERFYFIMAGVGGRVRVRADSDAANTEGFKSRSTTGCGSAAET